MNYNVKKKRKRKPGTKDRIYAVLVAGILIAAALITSLVMVYLHPPEADDTTVAEAPVSPPIEPAEAVEPVPLPPPAPPVTLAPPETVPHVHVVPVQPAPPVRPAPAAIRPPPVELPFEPPVSRGTLVFVIDDAGNNLRDLVPFLELGIPLTIAVLPGLPHSVEAARRIRAAGKEVFLHQPMEAIGGMHPGPGAIMSGMGEDEIRAILTKNLQEIGPVVGMNNHIGSRVTADEDAMEIILNFSREKGILFLDSRTTHESAAPRTAQRLGMNIGERDIFLDNSPDRESILRFLYMGLETAEQRGSAIMIGHVQSAALAPLLSELIPDLKSRGFSFSSASEIINRTDS